MRFKFLLLVLFFSFFTTSSFSQKISCGGVVPDDLRAFSEGEILSYGVKYSAAFLNISVADIIFTTTKEIYMGEDCFRINAVGRTKPFFNIFFKMEDIYDSWVVAETLRPLRANSSIREGAYRFGSYIIYDWIDYVAHTRGENLKSGSFAQRKLEINNCSADALSMFYILRSADLSEMKVDDEMSLNLVFEDGLYDVRLKYLGKDTLKISGMGDKVRSLKFTCELASSDGEGYDGGNEFLIWLSDDKNRIPIYLESPIRVGKVFATIESWEGLKYPLDCIEEAGKAAKR